METVSFLGWRSKASYQSPSVWNFNEPRSKLMSSEKRWWWEEFDWFTNYSGIRSGHVHLSSFYLHFSQFFPNYIPFAATTNPDKIRKYNFGQNASFKKTFYETATKICAIFLMVLTFTLKVSRSQNKIVDTILSAFCLFFGRSYGSTILFRD